LYISERLIGDRREVLPSWMGFFRSSFTHS
jgi:hypothetical protein